MRLGVLFSGVVLLLSSATAQAAVPLEVYGQLPSLENFSISPDGKHLAYVTDVNGKRTILISSLEQGAVVAGIDPGMQKLRDLSWGDNDHLVFTTSITRGVMGASGVRGENWMAQVYSLSRKAYDGVLLHGEYHLNVVLSIPTPRMVDGRMFLFVEGVTFTDQRGVDALYRQNLETGKNSLVEKGTLNVDTEWVMGEGGEPVARSEYNDDNKMWSLKIRHGAGYSTVYSTPAAIETPWIVGLMPDGKSILIGMQMGGKAIFKQFSMVTDAEEAAPAVDDSFSGSVEDPATHRLIGWYGVGRTRTYHFFDKAVQAAWDGLAASFPDEIVELVSWTADRKQIVIKVDGKRDGTSYFLIDLNTHKASFLGSSYKGVEPGDIAEVKFITYKAADGTVIPAYLTLPIGKTAKDLPLVVLPHGGPASRDYPTFDWWAQAIASRGYAVIQPQFRGSDGFGWDHMAAGFGQWGRKMQTDLSDGVRYLAGQGIIDPKRVCIVGASYGGYAALAGAALDRGVYRCAVADAPVTDPRNMLRWIKDRQGGDATTGTQRYWTRFLGATDMDDPKLNEISPLRHAADVNIPILLIHGRDDFVVPVQQSTDMESALRDAGKDVILVKLDGEDHWLSRSETRQKMLAATIQFLEAKNPPN